MLFEDPDDSKIEYLSEEYVLVDGRIEISKFVWKKILERHDKKTIYTYLHSLVKKHNIPFPYREYTDTEVFNDFSNLKNINSFNNVQYANWTSSKIGFDLDYSYNGQGVYLKQGLQGRTCSDLFAQKERMKCDTSQRKSPIFHWENYAYVFNPLISFNAEKVSFSEIRSAVGLTAYIPSQFSPVIAKTIYEIFDGKNVLDLSMGWGDRLVGALASTIDSYTGIDPNSNMHPIYQQIANKYKHNKRTKFICSPAEDAQIEPNQFDLIFTSPPYFDRERYSDEDTQSWKRYGSSVQRWLEGFLFKTMENSYSWLQEGGRLILNINDVSEEESICKPMLDYAQKLGFNYEGVIGYAMASRPGTGWDAAGLNYYEPVFVWRKGTGNPINFIENKNTLF